MPAESEGTSVRRSKVVAILTILTQVLCGIDGYSLNLCIWKYCDSAERCYCGNDQEKR